MIYAGAWLAALRGAVVIHPFLDLLLAWLTLIDLVFNSILLSQFRQHRGVQASDAQPCASHLSSVGRLAANSLVSNMQTANAGKTS